jgi:hypothetical protein
MVMVEDEDARAGRQLGAGLLVLGRLRIWLIVPCACSCLDTPQASQRHTVSKSTQAHVWCTGLCHCKGSYNVHGALKRSDALSE